ncbi:MAG: hypothetical protein OXC48_04610 [Endozoicomonadaceae bacterium]|nr:hypothetical protein [Endozoicomonadaceae bacterium]
MDALTRAKRTAGYSPLQEERNLATDQSPANSRSGWFSGKQVRSTAGKKYYTSASVGKRLRQQYGGVVQQALMKSAKQTGLSERSVHRLFQQAEKAKKNIVHKNHEHLKKWLDTTKASSPAAKALHALCPYCHENLPNVERERITDYLQQRLFTSKHLLTKDQVEKLALRHLKTYHGGFQVFAPATAKVICSTSGLKPPVFHYHLQLWSEQFQTDITKNTLSTFNHLAQKAQTRTTASPFELRGKYSFTQQMQTTRALMMQLNKFHQQLSSPEHKLLVPAPLREALLADLQTQYTALAKHLNYLFVLYKNDFVNTKNMKAGYILHLRTAIKVLDHTIAEAQSQADASTQKIQAWQALREKMLQSEQRLQKSKQLPLPASPVKALLQYRKDLREILVNHGVPSAQMHKSWKKVWVDVTNDSEVKPVNKLVTVRQNGEFLQYQSVIKPAAKMRFYADNPVSVAAERDPFKYSYAGKACHSSTKEDTRHALNLQQTKLTTASTAKDQPATELFSGIRSGTTAAQHIADRDERTKAADNWAKEVVTAALLNKMECCSQTREKVIQGEQVSLNLLTTSLLTADKFRHTTHLHDDELQQQREQYEALQRLMNSNKLLIIYDAKGKAHQVKINLRLARFNTGVNKLSLNPFFSTLLASWAQGDKYNAEALEELIGSLNPEAPLGGWVQEWLDANSEHPKTDVVRQLAWQLKAMFNHKMHHTEGTNAYKFASRLVMLAYLVGAVPHFNCKSGKDRTGELDAHVKALACEIEQTGKVPPPERYWSDEGKQLVQAMLYGAGEQEVLIHNNGNPAFKTYAGQAMQGDLFSFLHFK